MQIRITRVYIENKLYRDEITNAKEYNLKYSCVAPGKVHRVRKLGKPSDSSILRYWDRLTEQEQIDWAQSYMSFIEYFEIHCSYKD